jgi:hypothetical protein
MKKEEKKKNRAKVFRRRSYIRKTGRSVSLKKTKERKAERGRAKVFSPPLAPAFGPSRIQKQSRAHIRTLILGRTSYSTSPP